MTTPVEGRSGTRWPLRGLLAGIVLIALALRVYPLHVFFFVPDQEVLPRAAVRALVTQDARPTSLVYPTGLLSLLRLSYGAAYLAGRVGGAVRDRADVGAALIEHPFPFIATARLWSALAGVATVLGTFVLGRYLAGARTGLLAALLLAVDFLHVRESHGGSLDVLATAALTSMLAVLGRAAAGPGEAWTYILAGAAGGIAVAFRYQVVVALLALPVARLSHRRDGRALRDFGLALAAAAIAFAVMSPYSVVEAPRAWRDLRAQLLLSAMTVGPRSLDALDMLDVALGPPLLVLAAIGGMTAILRRPQIVLPWVVALVPYTVALGLAGRVFARYLVPLLPVLSVFASYGVREVSGRLPRTVRTLGAVALVLVAIADPLARTIALDHLWSREDTRLAAGRWLETHVPDGETIVVPGLFWYSTPDLMQLRMAAVGVLGPAVGARLAARGTGRMRWRFESYGADGSEFDYVPHPGRWVVTAEHPGLPAFGLVPARLREYLDAHAERIATFEGASAAAGAARYEPPDGNYAPLRGFAGVSAPGPNIVVWRERPGDGP